MNGNNASERFQGGPFKKAVAVFFLLSAFLFFSAFSIRWGLRTFGGREVRNGVFARLVLSTGASDIRGTPRAGKSFRESIEWETSVNVPFRVRLLEAASFLERRAGWNIPLLSGYNSTFDAGGECLGRARYLSPEAERRQADEIVAFLERLSAEFQGIPILYCIPPCRFGPGDVLFDGVFDFSNEISDIESRRLASSGIDVLDLRIRLVGKSGFPRSLFYKTDHHFTVETALDAAREIADRLSSGYGVDVDSDALAPDRFRRKVLPCGFLGSLGMKASLALCKPDDFSIFETADPSCYSLEIPSKGISRTGGFDIFIRKESLFGPTPYLIHAYGAYLFGDNPIVRIGNAARPDGAKILVFSDSFDNALSAFLANGAGKLETVDLRHFGRSSSKLVADGPFDAIVVLWRRPPPSERLSAP